ncbi:MobC family plasmid mobilization relaxosome protein [Streptomyces sp. CRN 30]|uniref:MobC family plasmid mobilization relaxosome protein n=1 Tax=Streptomyces sp. CRN 30 TaxID=3075613 RepID=UPI002A80E019|nr:MobC family plasmid mobilization relaxosome protein [Streptomyces sp. CRN 30]
MPDNRIDTSRTNRPASYPFGDSASGGVSKGVPTPPEPGLVRRRGTPDEEAATEGGSRTQGSAPGAEVHAPSPTGRARPNTRRRPYRRRQRPHVRSTRLSDEELARITAGAEAVGLTVAGFLARSALAASRDLDRAAGAIADDRSLISEFFAARRHLGHIGNNLNQITRAVNSDEKPAALDAVLTATLRAVDRVQEATDRIIAHA